MQLTSTRDITPTPSDSYAPWSNLICIYTMDDSLLILSHNLMKVEKFKSLEKKTIYDQPQGTYSHGKTAEHFLSDSCLEKDVNVLLCRQMIFSADTDPIACC